MEHLAVDFIVGIVHDIVLKQFGHGDTQEEYIAVPECSEADIG